MCLTQGLVHNLQRSVRLRRVLLGLLAVYGTGLLLLTVCGMRSDLRPVDCLFVPGARVDSDGTPGLSLQGRLDTAVELYQARLAKSIVCTGGRGESGAVEAQAARDYLVARGIPHDAVLTEEMSHTTWENFVFAAEEMKREGLRSCLVVTDPFHVPRCLAMARELGLEPYSAPSFRGPAWRPRGWLYYTTRELGSWLKYGAERTRRAVDRATL